MINTNNMYMKYLKMNVLIRSSCLTSLFQSDTETNAQYVSSNDLLKNKIKKERENTNKSK